MAHKNFVIYFLVCVVYMRKDRDFDRFTHFQVPSYERMFFLVHRLSTHKDVCLNGWMNFIHIQYSRVYAT